ncbi:MAG: TlpA family protein disulfide reductase [Gammaproteobacteria bacterium]
MHPTFFAAVLAVSFFTAAQSAAAAEVGSAAPACDLSTFEGPASFDMEAFKGKVVYLDFWASWCGPCAKSFPFMDDLHRQFKDKGLQLVGVNLDENPKDAKAFLNRFPVGFSIVSDAGGQCAKNYAVQAMPSSYLIGRDGRIRHVHLGFRAGEAQELVQRVEQLLAESPTVSGDSAGR